MTTDAGDDLWCTNHGFRMRFIDQRCLSQYTVLRVLCNMLKKHNGAFVSHIFIVEASAVLKESSVFLPWLGRL